MSTRRYLQCKLCSGLGSLPPRREAEEWIECSDCEGHGIVERGSDAHRLQTATRYRRKRVEVEDD